VDPGRDEILLDKSGYAFVRIYLGIQPGTSASHGSGAEVEQQMAVLRPRLFQSLIDVFAPGDGHDFSSVTDDTGPSADSNP
jgi:hypothetical protein